MAVDINAMMNNMMESAKAPSKSSEQPKDLMDILTGAFERALGGVCKIAGVSFISKVLDTGVDAGLKSEGVGVINKGAGTMGTQGGALYNALSGLLTFDFKGLVAAAIEPFERMMSEIHSMSSDGLQGVDVSRGELGNLTPNVTFGGSMVSQGLSV